MLVLSGHSGGMPLSVYKPSYFIMHKCCFISELKVKEFNSKIVLQISIIEIFSFVDSRPIVWGRRRGEGNLLTRGGMLHWRKGGWTPLGTGIPYHLGFQK